MNALFICTQNRLRSPTAEHIFATWPNIQTDSAGLGNDAEVPLSSEQLQWASIIFVMEKTHQRKLSENFRAHLRDKKIICLDIPDNYSYMQPELIKLLETRVAPFLR